MFNGNFSHFLMVQQKLLFFFKEMARFYPKGNGRFSKNLFSHHKFDVSKKEIQPQCIIALSNGVLGIKFRNVKVSLLCKEL
jgi:hypothetical protein